MKNVRLDGAEFVYDCDGTNCETPGVPHRVPLNDIMAMLDACYSEFLYNKDPRLEATALILNYLWRILYDEGMDGRALPYEAPWDKALQTLMHTLEGKYGSPEAGEGHSHSHHTHERAAKKLLN